MRLEWCDIDLAGSFITVAPEKSKTATRRLVPIPANLAAWLTKFRRRSGPVWHRSEWNYARALNKTAKAAKVKLRDNGLRHSFASYRLAQVQDAAKVSLEMGNSPSMVFAAYRELVKPADAVKWFAVAPETPANVIPAPQAASA